jgi:hypothetical protein
MRSDQWQVARDALGLEADFAEAEGAVTLAQWWAQAAQARDHQREVAALAARHALAAHRYADEQATALTALRQAATWLGLALLDAAAVDPVLAAGLRALLEGADSGEAPAVAAAGEALTEATAVTAREAAVEPDPALDEAPVAASAPAPASTAAPREAVVEFTPELAAQLQAKWAARPLAAVAANSAARRKGDKASERGGAPASGAHAASASADLSDQLVALAALRDRAGSPPHEVLELDVLRSELALLRGAVAATDCWKRLPPGDDRGLLASWLAARARNLQGALAGLRADAAQVAEVDDLIRALTKLVDHQRSGLFVHGLARSHQPQRASWLQDAQHLQRALDQRLGRWGRRASDLDHSKRIDDNFRRLNEANRTGDGPTIEALVRDLLDRGAGLDDPRWRAPLAGWLPLLGALGDPQARRLHHQLARELAEAEAEAAADEPAGGADPSWAKLEATRGRRLLIVGGDGRQERVPKIRAAFALAEVEWADLPQNAPRAKDAMVQRIEGGKYDFVVCLQPFISHELSDAVFGVRQSGVCCMLAGGYGIGQLRAAFERFLPR